LHNFNTKINPSEFLRVLGGLRGEKGFCSEVNNAYRKVIPYDSSTNTVGAEKTVSSPGKSDLSDDTVRWRDCQPTLNLLSGHWHANLKKPALCYHSDFNTYGSLFSQ
jgi:hypothetical protein